MNRKERLQLMAEEYGIDLNEVTKYYALIKDIPCVANNDEELLYDCLELLIQDRGSIEFIAGNKKANEYKSMKYSVSDALDRVYDELAYPYLCDEYKMTKYGTKRL